MLRRSRPFLAAILAAQLIVPATAEAAPLPSQLTLPSTSKPSVAKGKLANLRERARAVRPVRDYLKTSGFRDPHRRNHEGVDLAAPRGTAIYSVMRGRVIFADWDGAYGRKIVLDHGRGTVTVYAHLDSMAVKVGQRVRLGQRIGRVGTSGRTTGPHLHFEVLKHGVLSDPAKWMRALGVSL